MGAYSERPEIKLAQMKRETIETAVALFGWRVMYQTLRDKGIEVLRWNHYGDGGHMVTLRADYAPTTPGWKIAVYDELFTQVCDT